MSDAPPCVLVIAASDSSGGAGIARDLMTLGHLGVEAAVALTAVTVQTDSEVVDIASVDPDLVKAQIESALFARPIAAIKIGLLLEAPIVEAVAAAVRPHSRIPVVVDPVIASSSGTVFLDEPALSALVTHLLPLATLVTPNILELAALTGEPDAASDDDSVVQSHFLIAQGAQAVLVKGGHAVEDEAVDLLVSTIRPPVRLAAQRLGSTARGTGCMLSSAIAAHLARGLDLEESCRKAKDLVWSRLAA